MTLDDVIVPVRSPLSTGCGKYILTYILLRCNGYPTRTYVDIFDTESNKVDDVSYYVNKVFVHTYKNKCFTHMDTDP